MKVISEELGFGWEKRTGRVTGSIIGSILGVDQYRSANATLLRLARDAARTFDGLLDNPWEDGPDVDENKVLAWGHAHEKDALFALSLILDKKIEECGFFIHPQFDWFGSSPDGIILEGGPRIPVEVKCPAYKSHFYINENPSYVHQMQAHLEVLGAPYGYFYCWLPNFESKPELIKPIPGWLKTHLPVLTEFHDKLTRMLNGERYDSVWINAVDEYRLAKIKKTKSEEEFASAKERILFLANEQVTRGNGLAVIPGKPNSKTNLPTFKIVEV